MKKRRILSALCLMLALCFVLGGCNTATTADPTATTAPTATAAPTANPTATPAPTATPTPAPKVDIDIAALKGPTGLGMGWLMALNEAGEAANNYNFTISSMPDEVQGKLVSGELDIAAVPTNLASALYNKTQGGITLLAVNTLGTLNIVENGNTIQSLADLKGKTIGATGQGSNPEFILNALLEKAGLTPGVDVTVEWYAAHDELAALVAAGTVKIALIPEPNSTSAMVQNPDVRLALSVNDLWQDAYGESLMMGCVVARTEFVNEHPEAVAAFLEECGESVAYVRDNVDEGAKLAVTYGIIPKEPLAKKAIPNCNLTFLTGEEMEQSVLNYLNILFEAKATSIGGKLPDDAFFYSAQ